MSFISIPKNVSSLVKNIAPVNNINLFQFFSKTVLLFTWKQEMFGNAKKQKKGMVLYARVYIKVLNYCMTSFYKLIHILWEVLRRGIMATFSGCIFNWFSMSIKCALQFFLKQFHSCFSHQIKCFKQDLCLFYDGSQCI